MNDRWWKEVGKGVAAGVAIVAFALGATFAVVWLSGDTFGQRCEAAFPDAPAEQAWCIDRLNRGATITQDPTP